MKLPASFFNVAIYKNNLRRFGFIGILFAIVQFIARTLNLIFSDIPYRNFTDGELYYSMPNFWDVLVIFFIPVLLGIVLFRYIQEERALSVLHALPVTRRAYFGTNLVTFLVLYYGPIVLNIAVSLTAIGSWGFLSAAVLAAYGRYALMMLATGMGIFGITSLFGMLVGSSVLQGILTYVMMIVPYGLYHLFILLVSWLVRGYPYRNIEDTVFYLSPYVTVIKFFDGRTEAFWLGMLVFAIYAAATLLLSYRLYMKRNLEKHHELLAWNGIREGFVYILTTIVTLLIAVYVGEVSGDRVTGVFIGVFIGSAVGFSITKMVAYKTINIFKYYKGWLLYLGLAVAVFIVLQQGMFGYEKRIPALENVESVIVSEHGSILEKDNLEMLDADGFMDMGYDKLFKLTTPEAVMRARDLHEYYVDGSPIEGDTEIYTQMNLYYNLESGGHLYRTYDGPAPYGLVKALYETKEIRDARVEAAARVMQSREVYQVRLSSYSGDSVPLDKSEVASLYDAYAKDLMSISYDEVMMGNILGNIEVTLDRSDSLNSNYKDYRGFELYGGSIHVIEWAKIHYPKLLLSPDAEDIEKMTVYDTYVGRMPSMEKPGAVEYAAVEEYDAGFNGRDITEKALIQQVLDLETVYGERRYQILFQLRNGGSLYRYYSTLPEVML